MLLILGSHSSHPSSNPMCIGTKVIGIRNGLASNKHLLFSCQGQLSTVVFWMQLWMANQVRQMTRLALWTFLVFNNNHSKSFIFPIHSIGIPSDGTCKCTYQVIRAHYSHKLKHFPQVLAKDEQGCATGFIYTCTRKVPLAQPMAETEEPFAAAAVRQLQLQWPHEQICTLLFPHCHTAPFIIVCISLFSSLSLPIANKSMLKIQKSVLLAKFLVYPALWVSWFWVPWESPLCHSAYTSFYIVVSTTVGQLQHRFGIHSQYRWKQANNICTWLSYKTAAIRQSML